jgi:hypothetical protein
MALKIQTVCQSPAYSSASVPQYGLASQFLTHLANYLIVTACRGMEYPRRRSKHCGEEDPKFESSNPKRVGQNQEKPAHADADEASNQKSGEIPLRSLSPRSSEFLPERSTHGLSSSAQGSSA